MLRHSDYLLPRSSPGCGNLISSNRFAFWRPFAFRATFFLLQVRILSHGYKTALIVAVYCQRAVLRLTITPGQAATQQRSYPTTSMTTYMHSWCFLTGVSALAGRHDRCSWAVFTSGDQFDMSASIEPGGSRADVSPRAILTVKLYILR